LTSALSLVEESRQGVWKSRQPLIPRGIDSVNTWLLERSFY